MVVGNCTVLGCTGIACREFPRVSCISLCKGVSKMTVNRIINQMKSLIKDFLVVVCITFTPVGIYKIAPIFFPNMTPDVITGLAISQTVAFVYLALRMDKNA